MTHGIAIRRTPGPIFGMTENDRHEMWMAHKREVKVQIVEAITQQWKTRHKFSRRGLIRDLSRKPYNMNLSRHHLDRWLEALIDERRLIQCGTALIPSVNQDLQRDTRPAETILAVSLEALGITSADLDARTSSQSRVFSAVCKLHDTGKMANSYMIARAARVSRGYLWEILNDLIAEGTIVHQGGKYRPV